MNTKLLGLVAMLAASPAAAQSTTAPACDDLAQKLVGIWGAREPNGTLMCFTYQFVSGGVLKTSSQNCTGGPSSAGTGTYSWTVNAACKLEISGGGHSEADAITFKDPNTFSWAGRPETYFRK
jgi:hypothetical protein